MEQPLADSSPLTLHGSSAGLGAAGSPPTGSRSSEPLAFKDQQVLSQLRRGNWSAMEELVSRYQDRLYSTMLRMVGHPEDAADLVQETFVRAMQNVARFEGKSSLYTWLFRIAVNLAISHRRAGQYRKAASLDAEPEEDGTNRQAAGLRKQLAQDTEGDPAACAEMRVEHERALAALLTLEPEFRAVIVLRDMQDCDYDHMAAILEVPVGTIKSRLFRARAALRSALTGKGSMDDGS